MRKKYKGWFGPDKRLNSNLKMNGGSPTLKINPQDIIVSTPLWLLKTQQNVKYYSVMTQVTDTSQQLADIINHGDKIKERRGGEHPSAGSLSLQRA